MMQLGLNYQIILDVYYNEIRSILEYGSVIFHSGVTAKLSNKVEKIKKLFCNLYQIILGSNLIFRR